MWNSYRQFRLSIQAMRSLPGSRTQGSCVEANQACGSDRSETRGGRKRDVQKETSIMQVSRLDVMHVGTQDSARTVQPTQRQETRHGDPHHVRLHQLRSVRT
jgi:hypothetical protein